jgi:hypothetical protein
MFVLWPIFAIFDHRKCQGIAIGDKKITTLQRGARWQIKD